jgi:hypothetical protein
MSSRNRKNPVVIGDGVVVGESYDLFPAVGYADIAQRREVAVRMFQENDALKFGGVFLNNRCRAVGSAGNDAVNDDHLLRFSPAARYGSQEPVEELWAAGGADEQRHGRKFLSH